MVDLKSKPWGWLVLFASTGTLICCALPILLVSLGMGTVVAALVSAMPILVTLSLYKTWMFAGSGLLILSGLIWVKYSNNTCPTDAELSLQCNRINRWNKPLLWLAASIWIIGFIAAYFAEYILL